MVHSCVTVSLVSEARGGPFVFWDDLPKACQAAEQLGFDAIEIFAPSAEQLDAAVVRPLLENHRLKLAAVGTGAGWVKHKLTLTHADPQIRARAIDFVGSIIDAGARLGAPAIIGSMQGRWGDGVSREQALDWLREALDVLGRRAEALGTTLLIEPLNRYETNLLNTVDDGLKLIAALSTRSVRLLADLFHMNIEEVNIAAALRHGGAAIGHVHFVDSNRRAAGSGHLDFGPIAAALVDIGYRGYVSAEALSLPNADEAARLTIAAYERYFAGRL